MAPGKPFSVVVHPYASSTPGSCAYEVGPASSKNAVIFIGGLGDGPHSTGYIRTVGKHVGDATALSYSVFEIRMRSSFIGFGTSSLAKDVEDISALVKYLRSLGREKIVLFGHSTGCQDCMEYADYPKHGNALVDGFILQAPVSDRESLELFFPNYQESIDYADKMIAEGRENDCMPNDKVPSMLAAPVSAYRLRSLAAKGGDDDYFSSDFDDMKVSEIWGRFKQPVLVLHSDEDEFIPIHVDQETVNQKYRDANPLVSPLSGLIPDAGHTVDDAEAQEWLGERVVQFLDTLSK